MIFLDALRLNLAIAFTLFLPGYFLLRTFKNTFRLNKISKLTLSFGLSLFMVDFLFLLLDWTNVPLNFWTVLLSIFLLLFVLFLFHRDLNFLKVKNYFRNFKSPSKKSLLLFFVILFAVAIRLFFLSERLLPQTTDLGHHMYWSKYIQEFQALPDYGMPDFIIGEHIIFAAIGILSGINFVSAMPIAILFLFNVFSLFACFAAAYELARSFTNKESSEKIALLTLMAIGIFYAVSPPQAKYVSGGVIGNILGNFFIPLVVFLLARFNRTRQNIYTIFFVLISVTLAYTHHLSAFIFLYSFGGFLIFSFLLIVFSAFQKKIRIVLFAYWSFVKSFFSVKTIIAILFSLGFIFFIKAPSYLNSSAIDIAVGSPSKETRVGLSLESLIETVGAWRFSYAFVGILILIIILAVLLKNKKSTALNLNPIMPLCLLLAWGIIIFFMSNSPEILKVDIPSNRISTYLSYPAAFLGAICVFYVLNFAKNKIGQKLFLLLFIAVFGTGFISGTAELVINKKQETDNKEVFETYFAAEYLNKRMLPEQQLLKDHIYLTGDTWVKLFFMRDYHYPLSRSFLKRYDDPVKPRETCTRDMIAIPDSEIGRNCFLENSVYYVLLKKDRDTAQFDKSENFSKIFTSANTVIYQRNY